LVEAGRKMPDRSKPYQCGHRAHEANWLGGPGFVVEFGKVRFGRIAADSEIR